MDSGRGLTDIYRRLLDRYGPQHWWPAATRFEMMVGAVLTQASAWTNVERAVSNLKGAGVLSPEGLRRLSEERLASLVYPSGYFNVKARRLKALAEFVGSRFDDEVDAMALREPESLRDDLLDVFGIGEETADAILLYAAGHPTFVVDAYTRRLFTRLGIAADSDSYGVYRSLFLDNLPAEPELLEEYHALIVAHGKEVCRPRPVCRQCCLLDTCPTGIEATAADRRPGRQAGEHESLPAETGRPPPEHL